MAFGICRWSHRHEGLELVWDTECGGEVRIEKRIYKWCPWCGKKIEEDI